MTSELFHELELKAVDEHRKYVQRKVTQDMRVEEELVYWIAHEAYWAGYQEGVRDI
ncbi:hypothetical protein SmphiM6_52 [Sinorhizobium phage phiM6]|nr:hypothetical protein SmphiM6_52 [Sinorhizobium phage phiM6]